jgi:hypothetical protein
MNDEAVSPVVAFMLLLMVVVSFISVLNAYYIPSLKQQSEISHLHEVEDSFTKITPDVLQVLTFRKNTSMKEPIQMGGGDVVFSPLKSSGYLETNTSLQNKPLSQITVSIGSTITMVSEINRSRVLYRPIGNFWTNQGYEWEDGVLSVTKGNRKTDLQYADNADILAASERKAYYDMMNPVIHVDTSNTTPSISIDLLNVEDQGTNQSVSSNGVGTIWVDLKESTRKSLKLTLGDTIKFDFSGTNESEIGFKSKINETFNLAYQYNKTIWDSDTYTLNATPNNAGICPSLNIVLWNLSIRVV